jgi:hypothetical protein
MPKCRTSSGPKGAVKGLCAALVTAGAVVGLAVSLCKIANVLNGKNRKQR